MKSTYAAPTVADRGDVVHTTLNNKPAIDPTEVGVSKGPRQGSNLSFGL